MATRNRRKSDNMLYAHEMDLRKVRKRSATHVPYLPLLVASPFTEVSDSHSLPLCSFLADSERSKKKHVRNTVLLPSICNESQDCLAKKDPRERMHRVSSMPLPELNIEKNDYSVDRMSLPSRLTLSSQRETYDCLEEREEGRSKSETRHSLDVEENRVSDSTMGQAESEIWIPDLVLKDDTSEVELEFNSSVASSRRSSIKQERKTGMMLLSPRSSSIEQSSEDLHRDAQCRSSVLEQKDALKKAAIDTLKHEARIKQGYKNLYTTLEPELIRLRRNKMRKNILASAFEDRPFKSLSSRDGPSEDVVLDTRFNDLFVLLSTPYKLSRMDQRKCK